MAQYNAETAGKGPKPDEHPYIKAPVALAGTLPARRTRERGSVGGGSTPAVPARVWVWIIAGVLIVLAIIGISRFMQSPGNTVPPLPKTPAVQPSKTTTKTPSGIPTASPTATGSAAASGTAPASASTEPTYPAPPAGQFTVEVIVKAGESTRIRMRADGALKYDATYSGGRRR